MEEEGTAEAAEVSTEAVEADFMEAAVLVEGATPSSADILLAGIVAAATMEAVAVITVVEVTTEAAATTAGAAITAVGAMATAGVAEVGVGAGDLAGAGPTGDMAGDIRTATTVTRDITRPIPIIPTRPMGLRMTT
jgi:hypothetical protein